MKFLNKDQFYQKYEELYDTLKSDFFKLETLKEYNEYGVTNWDTLESSEIPKLIIKAQKSLYSQKEDNTKAIDKGISFTRVRYLTFPISKYILRQFSSYVIANEIGEEINIFEDNSKKQDKNIEYKYLKDFLLFDNKAILVHKYISGELKGAYFSNNEKELLPYLNLKKYTLKKSLPLAEYLKNYNLVIPNII